MLFLQVEALFVKTTRRNSGFNTCKIT